VTRVQIKSRGGTVVLVPGRGAQRRDSREGGTVSSPPASYVSLSPGGRGLKEVRKDKSITRKNDLLNHVYLQAYANKKKSLGKRRRASSLGKDKAAGADGLTVFSSLKEQEVAQDADQRKPD